MNLLNTIFAAFLQLLPVSAGVEACTPGNNCTQIAVTPADPVTTQCISDRALLLRKNYEQAALIDDLTNRVKQLESEAAKPAIKPKAKKKSHRRKRWK